MRRPVCAGCDTLPVNRRARITRERRPAVKKISTVAKRGNEIFNEPKLTIGLDLGDRLTGACIFARLSSNKKMIVTTEYADISMPGSPMRTFVASPKAEGRYPGIWCFSDIFQLTPP